MLQLKRYRPKHVYVPVSDGLETKPGIRQEIARKHHALAHAPLLQRRISIGEVFAVAKPAVIKTLLGSCVAVCLLDPVSGIGGMNHILLPEGKREDQGTRFGVHAMEMLINEMMKLGANRRRFVAKAFGAGNVIDCILSPTVGELNALFVRKFLAMEAIPLIAERLGGAHAVDVSFRTDTGKVIVRSINGTPLTSLIDQEQTYRYKPVSSPPVQEEVTLF
jgi:chemotaxis receptor (MCP) glutamine deamidase CheD